MSQTRRLSLIEACVSTAIGFIASLLTWQFIAAPLYGIPVTLSQNLGITGIFTVVSILRGYGVRRLFNGHLWRRLRA